MHIHRWADATATPWRNGGGVTTEVARRSIDDATDAGAEGADFEWRLSVAEVSADGPFSRFEGVDRLIVLLSGRGMDLHVSGSLEVVELRPPYGSHGFAGELPVHARLTDGPTTDLNLMVRRDRWTAELQWHEAPCRIDVPDDGPAWLVVFVADGDARLPGGEVLHRGDVVEREGSLILSGDAAVLAFVLRPVGDARG